MINSRHLSKRRPRPSGPEVSAARKHGFSPSPMRPRQYIITSAAPRLFSSPPRIADPHADRQRVRAKRRRKRKRKVNEKNRQHHLRNEGFFITITGISSHLSSNETRKKEYACELIQLFSQKIKLQIGDH